MVSFNRVCEGDWCGNVCVCVDGKVFAGLFFFPTIFGEYKRRERRMRRTSLDIRIVNFLYEKGDKCNTFMMRVEFLQQ